MTGRHDPVLERQVFEFVGLKKWVAGHIRGLFRSLAHPDFRRPLKLTRLYCAKAPEGMAKPMTGSLTLRKFSGPSSTMST